MGRQIFMTVMVITLACRAVFAFEERPPKEQHPKGDAGKVSFNDVVRPILSEHCFFLPRAGWCEPKGRFAAGSFGVGDCSGGSRSWQAG